MSARASDKTGRAAAKARDRSAEFWKILTSNVDAKCVRPTAINLQLQAKGRIQVFEFLVTQTLAQLCPEFIWRVTGVSGDGGIDLRGDGEAHRYTIGAVDLTMTYVVIGQVKRSASYNRATAGDIIDRLILRDVTDTASVESLSHLLVVISGRTTKVSDDYRKQLRIKGARHLPGIPIAVMDADEFVRFWSADPGWVEYAIGSALSPQQRACMIDYLRAREDRTAHGWTAIVSPATGSRVRGAVLEVRVNVKAPSGLPRHHIGLAWRPGPDIQIVRPSVAAASDAARGHLRVALDDTGVVNLRLRFYALVDGDVSVGALELVDGAGWRKGTGTEPPSLSLGSVQIGRETLDFQEIPYVPDPQRDSATKLELALKRASAGRIEAFALVGAAGIGKTRLVDTIADRLQLALANDPSGAALSFTEPISITHETELSGSRRFLRDLALTLADLRVDAQGTPLRDDGARLDTWLSHWLSRHTRDAATQIDDSIAMLMSDSYPESAWFPIAFLLVICVLARASNGPVFLHLANLHWADGFELRVLEELIRRLRDPKIAPPNGIVIVLEGRTGEMSAGEGLRTTDSWRALYASSEVVKIELKTWTGAQSGRFLSTVLHPLAGGRRRKFDPALVDPRWHALHEHVLRVASGNPMQMVEYLRTLRQEGVLVDDGNGALVIAKDAALIATEKRALPELIALRVSYLRSKPENGALISLLQILADIGSAVDRDTFDTVASAMKGDGDHWRLRSFQVARIPLNDGDPEFQFVHETYRKAFRELGWSGDIVANRMRSAALECLRPTDQSPLHQVIAWARLMRLGGSYDRRLVSDTLGSALLRAEDAQDQGAVIQLCDELLRFNNQSGFTARSRDQLRMMRAGALMESGDWSDALNELSMLSRELPRRTFGFEFDLLQARIADNRGNVFGDLMRCAEGIEAVREGLQIVRRAAVERTTIELARCEASLFNRLGVLYWFSGRADLGLPWQWLALKLARKREPGGIGEISFLCEVGTVLLHRHPTVGRKLLARSMLLLDSMTRPHSSMDYIASQYQMARLVDPRSGASFVDVERRAHAIAAGRHSRAPSIYAASLAWLTAGAAAFMDGRWRDAYINFSEALTFSTRAHSDRVVWKARLALAAALRRLGDLPAATVHAREAAQILIASLDTVGDELRPHWAATIRLPLEQARRIGGDSDIALRRSLSSMGALATPAWAPSWSNRPASQSGVRDPFQVLHVRNGDDDIFLMG